MRHETLLGYGGLIVGFVATIAAGLQTYVAWESRNDFMRATVVAQIFELCSTISGDMNRNSVELDQLAKENAPITTLKASLLEEAFHVLWLESLLKSVDAPAAGGLKAIWDEVMGAPSDIATEKDVTKFFAYREKSKWAAIDACQKFVEHAPL